MIRQPAVAGQFYDGAEAPLRREVDRLLGQTRLPARRGSVCALIVPHAGYMYSGNTAAHGYKFVEGETFDSVVIVGPSHREYFDGVSIYPGDAYRTPLGDVAVDEDLRRLLAGASPGVTVSTIGHRQEHSVEVQLPFLQRILGTFRFVPMVMGEQDRATCENLARALVTACRGRRVLLVASSDLSHYHSYDEAQRLDAIAIHDIRSLDPDGLLRKLELHRTEACGGGPVAAVLKASLDLGASRSVILHHCNSGDVIPQRESVVGYVSAAVLRPH